MSELTKEQKLSSEFQLLPDPEDEDTIHISVTELQNQWLALCRQPGDLYESYYLGGDPEYAAKKVAYGPENSRQESCDFYPILYFVEWEKNRNGWTLNGEAIATDNALLYHRED